VDKKSLAFGAIGLVLGIVLTTSVSVLQQGSTTPAVLLGPKPSPTLDKFKASGYSATIDLTFLLMDAGRDKGIYADNGLDPEWVTIPNRVVQIPDIKEQISAGTKIGIASADLPLRARLDGVPVKIVAGYHGESPNKIFVKADGPIKTVMDLDGKKVGVTSVGAATYQQVLYVNKKFAIKAVPVPLKNLTNMVVALKLGQIDAFNIAQGAALRLVDSAELRIIARIADTAPKPFVSLAVYATDDLINQNPELVRRFVKATLETAKYLKENPNYAVELYIKRTNAPKDLAEKAISQMDWTPSGQGSGQDLLTAVKNIWQYAKDSEAIRDDAYLNIEDAVDIRFLP